MNQIHQWAFELVSESFLHIGGNDNELLLDMDGKPFLPATSWTGACRAYVEQVHGREVAARLFGQSGDIHQPSRLIFSDGICTTVQPFDTRAGIAINGRTKTVEDKAFYGRVTVSPGVVFEVALQLRTNGNKNIEDQEVVTDFLNALHSGAIRLGAYKSTGGGKFTIQNGEYVHYDCTDEQELLAFVELNKPFEEWSPNKEQFLQSLVQITVSGQTASPLLIAGQYPHDSSKTDRTYIRMNDNGSSKPIIPGTSLKGVLRHRVERIINILQVDKKYSAILFGTAREVENKTQEKQSGRLLVEDVVLEQDHLETRSREYDRIGINPVTGGVKAGAVLNEETILGSFKTTFTYRFTERDKTGSIKESTDQDSVSLALLLFALRDLAQQRLSVGSGVAVGRGYLDVDFIEMRDRHRLLHFDFNKKEVDDKTNWLNELDNALQQVEKIS